jgi:YrbI family 3-deoxy-D-manno-octulosonate 8-phosphate phosphatase
VRKADGVVAIVPARGGSKSIPRKNIKLLGGVPLIAYSIEAGLSATRVDRVIVSTDDEEIAAIARTYGAEVPFLRPASLAEHLTPDLPVFEHALQWLDVNDAWTPDIVVHLRPTSPIRPPNCVDDAVSMLLGDPTLDSVRGIVPAGQNPFKMWRLAEDGTKMPHVTTEGTEPYNRPRQELPAAYWQTGHIDAIRASTIRDRHSMSGLRIKPLIIDGAYVSDIDTEADWQRTEWQLSRIARPIVRPANREPGLPEDLRLVVFDFDGVMTDNRVWVNGDGEEWVACNRSDGLGLDQLRASGLDLLVLSTEKNPVVGARCRKLRLDYEQGLADKSGRLRELLIERNIDPADVAYVGNDVNDLECMRLVGCAIAVADAHPGVLIEADLVLTKPGGHGAVRELCDRVRAHVSRASHRV